MNMPPPSSWWSRNWKWFVPISGLTLLLFVGMTAGIFWLLFRMLQSSDAYLQAVARAEQNPAIITALGEPIREGPFVSGNIQTRTIAGQASGDASLAIPLSGPKGDGTLYVKAHKNGDTWTLQQLNFEDTQSHQRTDLLTAEDRPGSGSF